MAREPWGAFDNLPYLGAEGLEPKEAGRPVSTGQARNLQAVATEVIREHAGLLVAEGLGSEVVNDEILYRLLPMIMQMDSEAEPASIGVIARRFRHDQRPLAVIEAEFEEPWYVTVSWVRSSSFKRTVVNMYVEGKRPGAAEGD